MDEIWKNVNGKYLVSNNGLVINLNYRRTGKHKKVIPHKDAKGYLICGKGKWYFRLNRLVWTAFNGEIPKGYDIHHINGIKSDNRLENLCLKNHSEHSTEHNKEKYNKLKDKLIISAINANSKPVIQFTIDGTFIAEYKSEVEAEKITGIDHSNISACCKNKKYKKNGKEYFVKSAGGFIWKYKEVA